MRNKFVLLAQFGNLNLKFLTMLVVLFFFSGAFASEIKDDTGQIIKLSHKASRIISLAPDITEMLFAAGAGKYIVGTIKGSDYPLAAKKIPLVGNFNSVDVEKIVLLHPDLIIVWSEGTLAEPLTKLHIPIYYTHPKKLLDIPKTLQHFGYLAGTEKIANRAADDFLQQYHFLQKKYQQRKMQTVFYEVWSHPLITITNNNWINDVIELCGGKNIFANLRGSAPIVNLEAVLTANPDIIITSETNPEWKKFWSSWKTIKAVQNNNLITINPDLIERAGPRVLIGAEQICKKGSSIDI